MAHSFDFLALKLRLSLNQCRFKYNSRLVPPGIGSISRQIKCAAARSSSIHRSTYELRTSSRRSANYQPSSWSGALLESVERDNEGIFKNLEDEVRCMLDDEKMEPLVLLELVNDIDQLGLSYRYRESINRALVRVTSLEHDEVTRNLHASALYFRLLRQNGFEVSSGLFESFKGKNGNFKQSLALDVQGMLSLYEASHLAFEGETILDEAKAFTSMNLKSLKEFTEPHISQEAEHALEIPYHHRMQRLEARWKIEAYKGRNEKNKVLLELAKLDFNTVQSTLQRDLQEVSRWWEALDLADNLTFARDRILESFFWAVGMVFEPQSSKCRRALAKAAALITILDDIYDVYGSLEELEQLTVAVERWDLDYVKNLPDYMKLYFLALYNTVNDLAYDTLKEKGKMVVPHLKEAWADLCKSFLQEARWNYMKFTPSFEEYMATAWVSSSGGVLLTHAYFLVTENITEEAIECLDKHHDVLHWPSKIFRLYNDFSSLKAEVERGESTNAITYYTLETGQSEEIARQHISKLIEECWKKMNMELISDSPFEKPFIQIAIDLARIALCQYQNGLDAHSAPDVAARNRILSVLIEPIQLYEKQKIMINPISI